MATQISAERRRAQLVISTSFGHGYRDRISDCVNSQLSFDRYSFFNFKHLDTPQIHRKNISFIYLFCGRREIVRQLRKCGIAVLLARTLLVKRRDVATEKKTDLCLNWTERGPLHRVKCVIRLLCGTCRVVEPQKWAYDAWSCFFRHPTTCIITSFGSAEKLYKS